MTMNNNNSRGKDEMANLNESLEIVNQKQLEKKRRKQQRDQHNEALRGMLRRNDQNDNRYRW